MMYSHYQRGGFFSALLYDSQERRIHIQRNDSGYQPHFWPQHSRTDTRIIYPYSCSDSHQSMYFMVIHFKNYILTINDRSESCWWYKTFIIWILERLQAFLTGSWKRTLMLCNNGVFLATVKTNCVKIFTYL